MSITGFNFFVLLVVGVCAAQAHPCATFNTVASIQIVEDILKPLATAKGLKAECGFESMTELNREADHFIADFSRITTFDPYWKVDPNADYRASHIKRKRAYAEKLRRITSPRAPWASEISSIARSYQSNRKLTLLGRDYLNLDFSNGEEGSCDAPACTSYGDYSIVLPPEKISALSTQLSKSEFLNMMKIVIGHEIGHYVHDIVLHQKSGLAYREMMASVDLARYHLLVDAIGMRLSGATPKDVAKGLRSSTAGASETGDIPHRLSCWTKLPGITSH